MSHTTKFLRSAGLTVGVALLCLAASQLGAQVQRPIDTTKKTVLPAKRGVDTSATRIPLQKEGVRTGVAGGEVVPGPTQAMKDSLERAAMLVREAQLRADSILAAARASSDSIAGAEQLRIAIQRMRELRLAQRRRADSIAKANAAAEVIRKATMRGWYVGFAGGASVPQRNIRNGYTGGWNLTLPMGWDASSSKLGFRLDAAIDHLNGTLTENTANVATAASGDITVWSVNTGMKVRAHAPGLARTHVYALGGVGAHWLSGGVYGTTGSKSGTNLDLGDAHPKLGWNAGLGAAIAWGSSELFIESRFFQVKTDMPFTRNGGVGTYTSFTPIVVGLQWF